MGLGGELRCGEGAEVIARPSLFGDALPGPHPDGSTPSWFTPGKWWRGLEVQLQAQGLISGRFMLDPCGHAEAPVSRIVLDRGGRIFTAEDDGLAHSWGDAPTWVNPPYDSETLAVWVPECAVRRPRGGLALHVPAWTDRAWWQDTIEPERLLGEVLVWFVRGRLRYGWPGNPDGAGGESAQFPSAIIIWPARKEVRSA